MCTSTSADHAHNGMQSYRADKALAVDKLWSCLSQYVEYCAAQAAATVDPIEASAADLEASSSQEAAAEACRAADGTDHDVTAAEAAEAEAAEAEAAEAEAAEADDSAAEADDSAAEADDSAAIDASDVEDVSEPADAPIDAPQVGS